MKMSIQNINAFFISSPHEYKEIELFDFEK